MAMMLMPITAPAKPRRKWLPEGRPAATLRVARARARCLRLNRSVGAVRVIKETRWRVVWRRP